eukprot:1157803-Pelagomonas_calceolata.AAC.8
MPLEGAADQMQSRWEACSAAVAAAAVSVGQDPADPLAAAAAAAAAASGQRCRGAAAAAAACSSPACWWQSRSAGRL